MSVDCDCIIPYFDEGLRPIGVVKSALGVKGFSKIIVVDDGSLDKTAHLQLKSNFPQVTAIRLEKNSGKAEAIKKGFEHATAEYIFLLDGDLDNIKTEEIENAIQKINQNPKIGMIIMRRVEDETVVLSHWIRHDIIYSGQRILRRSDLEKIYKNKISGYDIEVAINTYMMRNHQIVYWMPFSIHNLSKFDKWGWLTGLKRGVKMFRGFIEYAGWKNFLNQTFFFCRSEAP